jgi:hypothetical protein
MLYLVVICVWRGQLLVEGCKLEGRVNVRCLGGL